MQFDVFYRCWFFIVPPIAALALFILKSRFGRRHVPKGTITWDPNEKAWKVSGYNDVVQLMKRPEIRANYLPGLMEGLTSAQQKDFFFLQSFFSQWPLFQDGQIHARTHRVLSSQFSGIKTRIHSRIQRTIDKVAKEMIAENIQDKTGEWDLLDCYAKRFPLLVIIDVLGFQRSDEAQLKKWADVVEEWFGGRGDTVARFAACQTALEEYWERAEALLRDELSDDCVAAELRRAEECGELKVAEVIPNLFFLMAAGHETTQSFIANSMLRILSDPALEERVRRCVNAEGFSVSCPQYEEIIEELLRYTSPIKCMYRQVARDFEHGGVAFAEGQLVHFLNHEANHDPAMFPDPAEIIPGRPNARKHLTFGLREHTCPGLRMGRRMGKVAIAELLRRMPALRLAVPPERVRRLPLDSISALESLPVIHSAP